MMTVGMRVCKTPNLSVKKGGYALQCIECLLLSYAKVGFQSVDASASGRKRSSGIYTHFIRVHMIAEPPTP
jgi:hypothetical protein